MKIAHLGPSGLSIRHGMGGAIERRIRELAAAQAAQGHEVVVYSPEDQAGTLREGGVEYRGVCCGLRGRLRIAEYATRASREVAREDYDVVHCHSLPEASLLCRKVRAVKVLSYDFVRFRRGRETPLYSAYRHALSRFTCLLPVSDFCLTQTIDYWRAPHLRYEVLHNGVNLSQFRPMAEEGLAVRRKHGLSGKRVILYVGRVGKQKGSDVLVEGFRRLRKRVADAALLVVGPPEQFGRTGQTDLTRAIQECGGIYTGAVAEESLGAYFNACDVFVMPTRQDEIFGMAAVEAQACGKPVVCSRLGGLPEVVTERSGLFFRTGDAEELARAVGALLSDERLLAGMSAAARVNSERFGWHKIAERASGIYERCRN